MAEMEKHNEQDNAGSVQSSLSPAEAAAPASDSGAKRRIISVQDGVVAAGFAITIGLLACVAWLASSSVTSPVQAPAVADRESSPKEELQTSSISVDATRGNKDSQPPVAPLFSVVVLPFANLSKEQTQAWYTDGITREMTANLSRVPGSVVIAPTTAFTYKQKPVAVKQIGHDLDARYALQGSVGRDGDQVRIELQLVDAETEATVWKEAFETNRAQLPELEDRITDQLAQTLHLELPGLQPDRRRAANPEGQELIMIGWSWYHRPYSTTTWQQAREAFERALKVTAAIDARVGLAMILGGRLAEGWSIAGQQDSARAERLLRVALDRDPNHATAHFAMGVLRQMQNRLTEARLEYETAITLDPSSASALYQLGVALMFLGQPDAGLLHIEKAIRLDPHNPNIATRYWALGTCHLLLGHVEEAIGFLQRARVANSRLWFPHLYLAGALGLEGELDQARTALIEALKREPAISSISRMRSHNAWIGNPQHWALQAETLNVGLRRAGFPDN
jgi:adenylate cyclase